MTYAVGQPVQLTKSLSVQAESGVALPPGASGTVIDVGDKEIVVRFPCLAEREEAVTFDADCAADYMPTARRASTSRPMTIVASTRNAVEQGHDVETMPPGPSRGPARWRVHTEGVVGVIPADEQLPDRGTTPVCWVRGNEGPRRRVHGRERRGGACGCEVAFVFPCSLYGQRRHKAVLVREDCHLTYRMRGPYEVSLWLQMSAKARTAAGDLNDPEMKQEMLRIADGYDALAARAAVLVARETKSTSTN